MGLPAYDLEFGKVIPSDNSDGYRNDIVQIPANKIYANSLPSLKDAVKGIYKPSLIYLNSPERKVDGHIKQTSESIGYSTKTIQRDMKNVIELKQYMDGKNIMKNVGPINIGNESPLGKIDYMNKFIGNYLESPQADSYVKNNLNQIDLVQLPAMQSIDLRLMNQGYNSLQDAINDKKGIELKLADAFKNEYVQGLVTQLPAEGALHAAVVDISNQMRTYGLSKKDALLLFQKAYFDIAETLYGDDKQKIAEVSGVSESYLPKIIRKVKKAKSPVEQIIETYLETKEIAEKTQKKDEQFMQEISDKLKSKIVIDDLVHRDMQKSEGISKVIREKIKD